MIEANSPPPVVFQEGAISAHVSPPPPNCTEPMRGMVMYNDFDKRMRCSDRGWVPDWESPQPGQRVVLPGGQVVWVKDRLPDPYSKLLHTAGPPIYDSTTGEYIQLACTASSEGLGCETTVYTTDPNDSIRPPVHPRNSQQTIFDRQQREAILSMKAKKVRVPSHNFPRR